MFFLSTSKIYAQHDTTYYQQYPHKLVVTLFQSIARNHHIQFSQNNFADTANISDLDFTSESKTFTGLGFDYDIFGFSIGVNSIPSEETYKKGNSNNTNIAFSLGSNKIAFETSFRSYQGFYDRNTQNYTLDFGENSPYFQKSSMKFTGFKAKLFYYKNHKKFSYKSAYASTHRQLKSAWSTVYSAGLYYNNLGVNESFFPLQVSPFYSSMRNLTNIGVVGLSTGVGASGNLVFLKRFFFNTTIIFALESQWRNYSFTNKAEFQKGYFALGGDFRLSFGYNTEKFMFFLSSMYDFSQWNNSIININNEFLSGQINFAYRFNINKPKWYGIIEKNKIYKLFQ